MKKPQGHVPKSEQEVGRFDLNSYLDKKKIEPQLEAGIIDGC